MEGENTSGAPGIVRDLAIISSPSAPFPDTRVNHPERPRVILIRGATGRAGETPGG